MMLIKTVEELKNVLFQINCGGKSVGFVPTMGALHEGHLSLMKRARKENQVTICSIFVNPTQFNNADDLKHYPRSLEKDIAFVQNYMDFIFAPSVEEVYAVPATEQYHFGDLETVMEGSARPSHFNGVAIIVKRLFDWIQPDRAYFGEKDFQQIAIIKSLVKQFNLPIQIVPCPIVRDENGLALSSRNMRLSETERQIAANIYRVLKESTAIKTKQVFAIQKFVADELAKFDIFHLEYYEIVNADTLHPIQNLDDAPSVVGCIAIYAGEVRLIDNIRYK